MGGADREAGSEQAAALAAGLDDAASAVIAFLEVVDPVLWQAVPEPGVWSIGKDAEHVIEAGVYHRWIVQRTIGRPVPSQRPHLERARLVTDLTQTEAVKQLRQSANDGASLVLRLTEAQLRLATDPARSRGEILADTIERVMIGHYEPHRASIEAKLRATRG